VPYQDAEGEITIPDEACRDGRRLTPRASHL